ncbi:hypothetical protein PVAP13_1NG020872 [Panicum virgatum]|uniref:Uncharacterized protein n=1 Tax=Panicum virgatum TaxID=38727 RepID=A0A8T0WZB5_PANVG|nr:hypothetical protein PVAP13_1NG020872 [Panicum virgatum]
MEMPMLTTEKTATRLDPRVFELPVYKQPSLQYRITSAIPKLLKLANNNFTGVIPQENEVIRDMVGVAPIEEKLTQHRLRWFGHVQRRPPEAPVRNGVLERVDNVKRGRGRPKLTWDESVKRDLKDWNISKEIALDRSAWRLAINVPEP